MRKPHKHRKQAPATEPGTTAWYRVPLVWFVLLLLVAILGACIHLVVLSSRHVDPEIPHGERVFRIPASAAVPGAPPDARSP